MTDALTDARIEAAKSLIRQGQYDKARVILRNVRHPQAKTWLKRLNAYAPSRDDSLIDRVMQQLPTEIPTMNWRIWLQVPYLEYASGLLAVAMLIFVALTLLTNQSHTPLIAAAQLDHPAAALLTATCHAGSAKVCASQAQVIISQHDDAATQCAVDFAADPAEFAACVQTFWPDF